MSCSSSGTTPRYRGAGGRDRVVLLPSLLALWSRRPQQPRASRPAHDCCSWVAVCAPSVEPSKIAFHEATSSGRALPRGEEGRLGDQSMGRGPCARRPPSSRATGAADGLRDLTRIIHERTTQRPGGGRGGGRGDGSADHRRRTTDTAGESEPLLGRCVVVARDGKGRRTHPPAPAAAPARRMRAPFMNNAG